MELNDVKIGSRVYVTEVAYGGGQWFVGSVGEVVKIDEHDFDFDLVCWVKFDEPVELKDATGRTWTVNSQVFEACELEEAK